jgi:hypothetical protein
MKRKITLVYDVDCPNAPQARATLRAALQRAGLEQQWTEYDRGAPDTPERLLHYGSPTILVDGVDVAGETGPAAGASCRIYPNEDGHCGVPSIEAIISAINRR